MVFVLAFLGGGILVLCAAYRHYQSASRGLVGRPGLDLLGSGFVGIGVSLPAAVLLFLAWMRNSDRRYWVMSGPYPLSALGSGPFQLWIAVLSVVLGCILISLGLTIRSYAFSSTTRNDLHR